MGEDDVGLEGADRPLQEQQTSEPAKRLLWKQTDHVMGLEFRADVGEIVVLGHQRRNADAVSSLLMTDRHALRDHLRP